jgi:hypothetical protein
VEKIGTIPIELLHFTNRSDIAFCIEGSARGRFDLGLRFVAARFTTFDLFDGAKTFHADKDILGGEVFRF